MGRLLLMFGVLAVLGGGAGAYFYVSSSHASTPEVDMAAEAAAKELAKTYTYVAMAPILLPIIDSDGRTQTVSIVVSLQVADDLQANQVRNRLPLLTDAFLSDMYGTLSRQAAMEGGVLRVSMVKERLKTVTARVMPGGVVEDVLLQVLQQYRSG